MLDTEIEDRIWLSQHDASILTFPISTLVLRNREKYASL